MRKVPTTLMSTAMKPEAPWSAALVDELQDQGDWQNGRRDRRSHSEAKAEVDDETIPRGFSHRHYKKLDWVEGDSDL